MHIGMKRGFTGAGMRETCIRTLMLSFKKVYKTVDHAWDQYYNKNKIIYKALTLTHDHYQNRLIMLTFCTICFLHF